jgi:hypothetical protein
MTIIAKISNEGGAALATASGTGLSVAAPGATRSFYGHTILQCAAAYLNPAMATLVQRIDGAMVLMPALARLFRSTPLIPSASPGG